MTLSILSTNLQLTVPVNICVNIYIYIYISVFCIFCNQKQSWLGQNLSAFECINFICTDHRSWQ